MVREHTLKEANLALPIVWTQRLGIKRACPCMQCKVSYDRFWNMLPNGGAVMTELTAEDVFRIHPKIRWVGLTTERGEVVFSRMRPGIESFTPDEDDRFLLQFGAILMNGITQRSDPWLGRSEYMAIAYEKTTQLILRLGERYLAMTVEKSVQPNEIEQIANSIRAVVD